MCVLTAAAAPHTDQLAGLLPWVPTALDDVLTGCGWCYRYICRGTVTVYPYYHLQYIHTYIHTCIHTYNRSSRDNANQRLFKCQAYSCPS